MKRQRLIRICLKSFLTWSSISLTLFFAQMSCHFLENGNNKAYFRGDYFSLEDIDDVINQIEEARSSNEVYSEWLKKNGDNYPSFPLYYDSSWKETLGELYALKSLCHVKHTPVYILSEMCISFGCGCGFPDGTIFILCGVCSIPIDIIQLPFQIVISSNRGLSVTAFLGGAEWS